jgi:hypothetical protein
MRTYLVVDLPHSSLDATDLLNKHADHGWSVIGTLTWGNGDNGAILERHTTRHQDAVALAGEDVHEMEPTDNPRKGNPRVGGREP